MQNKILNFISLVKGFCFVSCLFICPRVFLSNTTQNPFAVQSLLFSIFGSGFILCCVCEITCRKQINFHYSKLDFIFIIFLLSLLLSLIINYILGAYKTALINEFLRKSDYIIFGLIFGFLFAKITTAKIDFTDASYKFFKNIFLWCLAWSLWKMQASVFIAVLIFGAGIYLCYKHIKDFGIKEILDVMLAVCFCACLYGIMQALGLELFWVLDISKEFGARPVSTFGNPNFLASFVLIFLPYSLLLFLQAKNKKENLISGFITLVLALFLVISGTRSAWIGLIGEFIICVGLSKEFRKIFVNKFLRILILFLIFCACAPALVSNLKQSGASVPGARISEVKQIINLKTFSLQSKNLIQPLHQRLMMWHCAFENFKSSPVFGKGINSFQLNFPYCQGKLISKNTALDKIKLQANAAHNEYLEILSDGGLISFLIYVLLWFLFVQSFCKNIRTLEKKERYFYCALFLGLIGVLIDNLFNITLRTLSVSFAFWFAFSSINNLNVTNKKFNLNYVVSILIFVVTCFGICVLINFQVKNFTAQIYELKGYKNLVKENYQDVADNMAKAIKLSSLRPEPYYILIRTEIGLNRVDKVKEISDEVLKFYPMYYEFRFYSASLQLMRDNAGALVNLRENLALLPTYSPAAELFGSILINQNYVSKEDKSILENLIETLPYDSNLPSYLAEIYFKENNCPNAATFAFKALQKNIFDKPALEIFIACGGAEKDNNFLQKIYRISDLKNKIKLRQDENLLKEITKLQTEYPAEYEIYALLAEFYFRRGEFCKSRDILRQAKKDNFFGKSYNLSLSLAARKCGDLETSKQALEEILFFCPYDELAKNGLKNVNI